MILKEIVFICNYSLFKNVFFIIFAILKSVTNNKKYYNGTS